MSGSGLLLYSLVMEMGLSIEWLESQDVEDRQELLRLLEGAKDQQNEAIEKIIALAGLEEE